MNVMIRSKINRHNATVVLRAILTIGIFAFGAAQVCAEEVDPGDLTTQFKKLSLEELMAVKIPTVYTASKHEQKVTEAPASVSIVSSDEIQKYGYRTLADILRSLRGFYVTYDRNYSYIGVRGFNRPGDYGGRVLILVDGHRLNDSVFDTAASGTDFLLDVDLVERVEVIRGPGSSLYGNNAFFGVINVITRKGSDLNGVEISGAAASYDSYTGRISYGNRFTNGLELLLSGSLYDSEGHDKLFYREFDVPESNNGIARNRDHDGFHSFFSSLSYGDFTLEGGYVSRRKQIPTASFDTVFNDPREVTTDSRAFVDLKFAHEFSPDLGVMARVYYDYYGYHGDYPYIPGDDSSIVMNRDVTHNSGWGMEAQVNKRLWEKHELALGAEYRDNFQVDQRNFDAKTATVFLDSKTASSSFGLYVQDEFTVRTNLIFNAGVRYDHFSTFGHTVNPRLAAIWSPIEKTTFKAVYGQAFRAPNAAELYYQTYSQVTNPDLGPETIRSYQFIYEQDLPAEFRLSSSVFYNDIKDLISLEEDENGIAVYKNLDHAFTRGADVELEWKSAIGFASRISYTFQQTYQLPSGDPLSNSPEHLAKLNFIVPLVKDKLFTGFELQYGSSVKTLSGREADGFWVANLTLYSQKIVKGLELSASIYNLFDTKYEFPGGTEHAQDVIRQDGRSFRIKLTYNF